MMMLTEGMSRRRAALKMAIWAERGGYDDEMPAAVLTIMHTASQMQQCNSTLGKPPTCDIDIVLIGGKGERERREALQKKRDHNISVVEGEGEAAAGRAG
jgi:hypothetical protein